MRLKLLISTWLILILLLFSGLWWYKTRPGAQAQPLARWPASSSIRLGSKPYTLIMFIHPRCECSEASVYELQRLLAGRTKEIAAIVVFYRPLGALESWSHSALWEKVASTESTVAIPDEAGKLAYAFGARTSGQAYLYDSGGLLRFSGGLTETRGHVGESPGGRAIAAIVSGASPEVTTTAAFGCALLSQKELSRLSDGFTKEVPSGN